MDGPQAASDMVAVLYVSYMNSGMYSNMQKCRKKMRWYEGRQKNAWKKRKVSTEMSRRGTCHICADISASALHCTALYSVGRGCEPDDRVEGPGISRADKTLIKVSEQARCVSALERWPVAA